MISPHKDETSKVGQFRAQVNKWIANNKDLGCSQFQKEVHKLKEIYLLLVARQFASIKEKYDVDYFGFLNLYCKHPKAKNAWIHQQCLLPFVIKIEDYMETCAETLHRIQHIESPANKFSWNKKFGFLSSNISVSNGKFSSNLDDKTMDKTMVVCQGVTDASGNLFTGRLRFFGDRIHSTLEPHRLCEFPKLQTKNCRLISSSMISAELQDDKGNQLYTKNPIKVVEKVPDMINNQTARTFKKFVFDPVDGVWVEKPGLIFNEGNRTFEYQFDTIDSLGPAYVNNLIKRFTDVSEPKEMPAIVKPDSEQDLKLKFKIQVYESVDKTFGHETYLPKCLRQKYVEVFLRQPIEIMHLYQERMALIQVGGRRFYFVPQNYQLRVVSAELETDPSDANRWNQSILLHNEDSKTKAEETGFLSIDLASFTFTRKQNAQKISIFSDFFKEISPQGKLVQLPSQQQVFTDKLQQKAIARSERSIISSISEIVNPDFAGQIQSQKKLIEQITLQTVFIAERRYHMHLINYLLQSINYKNKKAKIISGLFKKQIISRAKIIEDQEKKRLLSQLKEMRSFCKQIKMEKNEESCLELIQNEHTHVFGHIYTKQFKQSAEKLLNSYIQDTKTRMEKMKELYKEVVQCISFLKKMKSLRSGGGVPFQRLLASLGDVCQEYIRTMQTNVTLNTQRVSSAISLNASDALINDDKPFESMKTLLQGRSASLSTFLSRQSFKTPDDTLLQGQLPVKHLRFIKLPQDDIQDIKKEALRLVKSSISGIIDQRVAKQQIEKKVNAAYENSGLAKIYRRWKEQPKQLNDYKEMIKKSVRSRMGSQAFGNKCKQFIVKALQKDYCIEVNESKQDNIDCLNKKIMEIKKLFVASQDYQIEWKDRIEAYFPKFASLQSTLESFIRVYTNTDGQTFQYVKWSPFTAPPYQTSYNYDFNVTLIESAKLVKGKYIDCFIINDKGKVITRIAQDLQLNTSLLKQSIQQNTNGLLSIASKEKDVKLQALKKQLMIDLTEKRKQEPKYQRPVNRKRHPIDIPNVGQLTPTQEAVVQQTFREEILPRLETGNVKQKCQMEITKVLKELKEDELIFTTIAVDQKFHEDTIKDLKPRIDIFENWVKDAADLQDQYKEILEQYELIQQEKLQAKYSQLFPYSLQLHYQVITKNAILQGFMNRVKEYNQKTTKKLRQTQSIDKELFEMDWNKIKISFSLESIQEISSDVRGKVDQLMDCVVERKAGQQDAIQNLQKSLGLLNGLQLNNNEDQMAAFDTTIGSLRSRIRSAMQGNELPPSQLRLLQKNLQAVRTYVHQMKKLKKFIDPR